MNGYRVAIVGATSPAGQETIKVLEQRNFPVESISLLTADYNAGKKVFVYQREVEVKEVTHESFREVDLALFVAGSEVSHYFSPIAVQSKAIVIDNSQAFSTEKYVPVVVPEINPGDLANHRNIIASPGCLTIQIALALFPLHRMNQIKRLIVAAYQAVSDNGFNAIDELTKQSRQILEGQPAIPHVYPHQIAFNLLPETDVFLDNGYSKEEQRLADEIRKVLHADDIAVSATCVRVPVFTGHGVAVHVEFSRPISVDEARNILGQAPGVKVLDDPAINLYPMPWSAIGTDEVFVGRIHDDLSHPNGLVMWIVTDNLRKGSALNIIQIAEEIIKRK